MRSTPPHSDLRIAQRLRRFVLATSASLLLLSGCADDAPTSTGLLSPAFTANRIPAVALQDGEYRLHLYHLHTAESMDVVYRRNGQLVWSGIRALNHLLRDWRTNQDANYPVKEFDLLHALLLRLGRPDGVIQVVCGFRSPQTNRFLRTRSSRTGVAEHSEHTLSQAIDIEVPGVSTVRLRDAALSLAMGGVGYYPQSGFVHVDVGPVRSWSFGKIRHVSHTAAVSRHRHFS